MPSASRSADGCQHGPTLVYQEKRLIPARVFGKQGYKPFFQPDSVMQSKAPPLFPFKCEFYHPTDHVSAVPDNRRFPPAACEEFSLLWRSEEWRKERSQVMCLPASCTEAMQGSEPVRTQKAQQRHRERISCAIGAGYILSPQCCVQCQS